MQDAVVAHRARYLVNRLQKDPSLKTHYLQSFKDELIDVNKDECQEVAECGCENVKRTKNKIPRPVVLSEFPFTYVGNPTGTHPYGWTTFGAESFMTSSRFTGKRPRHTYLNEYIYVFNAKNDTHIRGEGVFLDPRALKHLQSCKEEGKNCYSDSVDFPIDDDLIQVIIEAIMKIDLNMKLSPPQLEEEVEIKPDRNV
jgi:hypothetical protein